MPEKHAWTRWFWGVMGACALVQLVLLAPRANAPVLSVRLRGLQEDAVYEDDGGTRYTGAALMKAGLALPPMRGDYSSIQIEFQRLLRDQKMRVSLYYIE